MKILVIIVSYKDEGNLEECIGSLRTLGLDFDVCMHDNSDENIGFAAGVNVGLKKYLEGNKIPAFAGMTRKEKYDWVWLLNPDCRVEVKGILEEFIGVYGKRYDIFSPVVYDQKGKIWFAGGKIDKITGECRHVGGDWGNRGDKGDRSIETSWETEWVSGCSMFVKPAVFEKIGFFDEKFFLFYEDVDFCLRARAAGFRVGIGSISGLGGIGSLKIIHKVSQSVNKLSNKYEIEMKSKFYLLKKHWREFCPTAYLISKLRYLKHKHNQRR